MLEAHIYLQVFPYKMSTVTHRVTLCSVVQTPRWLVYVEQQWTAGRRVESLKEYLQGRTAVVTRWVTFVVLFPQHVSMTYFWSKLWTGSVVSRHNRTVTSKGEQIVYIQRN